MSEKQTTEARWPIVLMILIAIILLINMDNIIIVAVFWALFLSVFVGSLVVYLIKNGLWHP